MAKKITVSFEWKSDVSAIALALQNDAYKEEREGYRATARRLFFLSEKMWAACNAPENARKMRDNALRLT